MNREGADVTEAYQLGAEETLRLAELLTAHGISVYGESRIDELLNELDNYT